MTGQFYGVLGVGPDADEERIRQAYRERVKDHHPDVSADPDAGVRFKRLTTARDTLADATERARYDRLGHDAYVNDHADASVWNAPPEVDTTAPEDRPEDSAHEEADSKPAHEGDEDEREYATESADTDTGGTDEPESRATGADGNGRGTGSQRAKTTTSSEASSEAHGVDGSETDDSGTSEPTGEPNSPTATTGATAGESSGEVGSDGEVGSGGMTATAGQRERRGGHVAESSSEPSGGSTGSGPHATSSFWTAHEPGETYSAGHHRDPVAGRVWSALSALGPWLFVHVLFLALAFGTCWYALTAVVSDPASSLPVVFAMVGEACLAVVLTGLHAMSRIYR